MKSPLTIIGNLAIVGSCCIGCIGGVASARYQGVAIVGTTTSYSFDERANPRAREPIADALVELYVVDPHVLCEESKVRNTAPLATAKTNDNGVFLVKSYYSGGIGTTDKLLICVSHPDFKPFYYETIIGKSTEPRHGEKFLNIQLERK